MESARERLPKSPGVCRPFWEPIRSHESSFGDSVVFHVRVGTHPSIGWSKIVAVEPFDCVDAGHIRARTVRIVVWP